MRIPFFYLYAAGNSEGLECRQHTNGTPSGRKTICLRPRKHYVRCHARLHRRLYRQVGKGSWHTSGVCYCVARGERRPFPCSARHRKQVWRGGNKKTDRGLVIVVAVDDRKYFIAPGDGLEGDLTDVECDDIARSCIVKNMRKGNPDMAMLSTAKAIYNKFKTGETGIESPKEDADDAIAAAIILSVVFFWIIWSIRNRGNNGRGGGRRGGSSTNSIFWGNPGHMNDRHFGGGFGGGSFGGGSFGGGGSGGGW